MNSKSLNTSDNINEVPEIIEPEELRTDLTRFFQKAVIPLHLNLLEETKDT